jgi:hypothetical protein
MVSLQIRKDSTFYRRKVIIRMATIENFATGGHRVNETAKRVALPTF